MRIVGPLTDLQTRNVFTRPELGLEGVYALGDEVRSVLEKLVHHSGIAGWFFTHYFDPPNPPHVKIGIRYENAEQLAAAALHLDELCARRTELVAEPGRFEPTTGEWKRFPDDLVVDYVVCRSFDLLLDALGNLGDKPSSEDITSFVLSKRNWIADDVTSSPSIFRIPAQARPLSPDEIALVWERLVHHFLNAYKASYQEPAVKARLRAEGVDIS